MSIVNTDEYQNDGRWPKLPRTNPDDARRGRNFLLVGLTLIFMLIWLASPSDEENVLVRENAAANSVSGTYSVYSGSTTAELCGVYKGLNGEVRMGPPQEVCDERQSTPLIRANAFGLSAYVINHQGIWEPVEEWQVGAAQTPRLDCGDVSCIN